MNTRNIWVTIPANEMSLFEEVIKRMGWQCDSYDEFLDDYLASRPKNIDITEEEIMAEVAAVRYGK
mgnify:CR=1 FL=1